MNLPRLIVADEIRSGTVAAGITLIYALKRAGVKVKVFASARDEADMRLLRLLLDEPVVSLDVYTSGSVRNLKTLFQLAADPGALNIVLAPLGTRVAEDFIQIRPEAMELAKALNCGVLPVISAAASAIITSNIAIAVLDAFDAEARNCVPGVVFSSVKNPREYQLLEQDYGRRSSVIPLGYIPKESERPMPSLQDLYATSAATQLMQIKSAAIQLAGSLHQIEWHIIEAFGILDQEWTPPQESAFAPKNFKVAVVGEKLLSLEGNNSALLFRHLGCSIQDYNPWEHPFPMDAEAIYFPHSLGNLYADRLLSNEAFCRGIKQSVAANKLIFANGASAPLFAQFYVSAEGRKQDALGIFPFHGRYSSLQLQREVRRVEIRGLSDTIFSKTEEKMRGYALDYVHISNPGNLVPPVWAYRDVRKGEELGNSGWLKGYCFITDLYLDLWSCPDLVNRWLMLRKR